MKWYIYSKQTFPEVYASGSLRLSFYKELHIKILAIMTVLLEYLHLELICNLCANNALKQYKVQEVSILQELTIRLYKQISQYQFYKHLIIHNNIITWTWSHDPTYAKSLSEEVVHKMSAISRSSQMTKCLSVKKLLTTSRSVKTLIGWDASNENGVSGVDGYVTPGNSF